MPIDISAFVVSSDGMQARNLALPRAPALFGLLTGIRGYGEAMFTERGRLATIDPVVSNTFDECMVFGESHLSATEFRLVLEAWAESDAGLRAPYLAVAEAMCPADRFVFAFFG